MTKGQGVKGTDLDQFLANKQSEEDHQSPARDRKQSIPHCNTEIKDGTHDRGLSLGLLIEVIKIEVDLESQMNDPSMVEDRDQGRVEDQDHVPDQLKDRDHVRGLQQNIEIGWTRERKVQET